MNSEVPFVVTVFVVVVLAIVICRAKGKQMKRKSTKNTRGPNKAEKDFQAWLKDQPCCITGELGVQVHHCKGSTFKHNKVLIGHWFCIPLSVEKHEEYHAGSKEFRDCHGMQAGIWRVLAERYNDERMRSVVPVYVFQSIMDSNE